MRFLRPWLLFLSLVLFAPILAGEDMEFQSGNRQLALIELYTSEGCSSCPPADRWLSRLKAEPGLWKTFVPIAFHVDYWDYIGWDDRFASAAFSDRQRRYAREGGARFVYTPGFFQSGEEWSGWRRTDAPGGKGKAVGNLSLRIRGDDAEVRFRPIGDDRNLIAHVAVLGMNLETRVKAGENKGRTLRHDFVALDVASAPLLATDAGHRTTIRLPESEFNPGERAIVAWVSTDNRQTPLQAVGGVLSSSNPPATHSAKAE